MIRKFALVFGKKCVGILYVGIIFAINLMNLCETIYSYSPIIRMAPLGFTTGNPYYPDILLENCEENTYIKI